MVDIVKWDGVGDTVLSCALGALDTLFTVESAVRAAVDGGLVPVLIQILTTDAAPGAIHEVIWLASNLASECYISVALQPNPAIASV